MPHTSPPPFRSRVTSRQPSHRRILVVSALFLIALLSILWLEARYGPPDHPWVVPATTEHTPTDGEDPWYLRGSLWLHEAPVSP